MSQHRGDDLDDDFVPDDLVALSGEESDEDVPSAEDGREFFTAEDDQPQPQRGAEIGNTDKKRKRREKDKQRKAKKRKLTDAQGEEEPSSIAAQSPEKLAEYVANVQSKTFSNMSHIELNDMRIPESSIADTTMWTGLRTLDTLPDFIAKVLPTLRTRLGQRSKNNASPTLIYVTGAALRVADVTRVLKTRTLRGDRGGEIAKLFARHIKLEEHVTYLKRTKIGAAVGTSGRLGKLLEIDALSVSALTHIMLDVSHRDAKKRSVLDIPETRDEVFAKVLASPKIMQALKAGTVQLILF